MDNPFIKLLFNFDIELYEKQYWDEIWGCVEYIKIPYDTVMNMPLQDRRIWIQKHNASVSQKESDKDNRGNISGAQLNSYAKLEMGK